MLFYVKKGMADPFRGNWYVHENSFDTESEAIISALELTNEDFIKWGSGWDEYGWEWSVFRVTDSSEEKIWEGFKAISTMRASGKASPEVVDGRI
jgi:hypothetical protein